jgi:hypothetical protein
MLRILTLCALCLTLGTASASAASRSARLLGVQTVAPVADNNRAGTAEAFPFRATRAGSVTSLTVYVDRRNRARRLLVALYSSVRGRPSVRLAAGSMRSPRAGAWNAVKVKSRRVRLRHTYWIAILGRGGTFYFRDRSAKGCISVSSRSAALRSLPSRWASGRRWHSCPLSARANGPLAPAPKPGPTSGTPPTGAPAPAPPAPGSGTTGPSGGNQLNCGGAAGSKTPNYAALDACGYPSPNTTGVPAGTALTPVESAHLPPGATWSNGELDISGSNVTISGLDIDGNVHITGPHATLENSSIHGDGDPEVLIYQNATDTLMVHDQITAPSSTIGAVNNAGGQPFEITASYLHDNCTGVLGLGDVIGNYIITDGNVPGCHVEDIYVPGGNQGENWAASPWGPAGPSYTNIQHNTLLNPLGQTASVFLDNHAYGPNANVTENNNLMAGGGYITYGDSNGDGSTNIVITNNRFSRLYYPKGGYYGAEQQNNAATTFGGNIWDDTRAAVKANS